MPELGWTPSSESYCDTCLEFGEQLAHHEPVFDFSHKSIVDVQASASQCSLCHFIASLGSYNTTFKGILSSKDTSRIYFNGKKDKDGATSSIEASIWTASAYRSPFVQIAVHIDDDIATSWLSRLPPMPNQADRRIYDLIKAWLSSCDHEHRKCNRAVPIRFLDDAGARPLPTRILDVGTSSTPYLRLLETDGIHGRYCALSYCWGQKNILKTTSNNLADHLAGKFGEAPKTFEHAIQITRDIDVRYLWIDSLCIVQDDKSDWLHESERMGAMYANAYLTIAASDASDSTAGCFLGNGRTDLALRFPVTEDPAYGIHLSCLKTYPLFADSNSPLRKRAWALQERLLSQRIVHCTKGGLIWTCKQIQLNERNEALDWKLGREDPFRDWYRMIESYTEMDLTHTSDRLIALEGLISLVKPLRDDANVFGTWAKDLPGALLWYINRELGEGMRSFADAPTWSWPSKDGIKSFEYFWSLDFGDSPWMEKEMVERTRLIGRANDLLVLRTCLFKTSTLLLQNREYEHRTMKQHRFTPEIRMMKISKQIFSLHHFAENVDKLNPIGIATLDDRIDIVHQERQSNSSIICAYLFNGVRHIYDKVKRAPYLFCANHMESSASTCEECQCYEKYVHLGKSRILYWVLLLEPITNMDHHYRRIGMGVVLEAPTQGIQEITIH